MFIYPSRKFFYLKVEESLFHPKLAVDINEIILINPNLNATVLNQIKLNMN